MEESGLHFNWIAIAVAAISTLVVGFIYYHPKVMGTAWMNETGMTPEKAKTSNMALTMGLTVIFSFLVGVALTLNVQHGGPEFQTFKHGAYHGAMTGIFMGLPILGVPGLFEMRSWRYILINAGYWVLAMAIMGGIICAWN